MNIVSFGGGTNSTAMIIGMYNAGIPVDLILFSDPGAEQPHTYAHIDEFNGWLTRHGLPEIVTIFYTDKNGDRLTLERECLRSESLPSIAYGFKRCSLKHKVAPQEKFCNNDPRCRAVWESGERVNKFQGYDAGEPRRVEHARAASDFDKKYKYNFPLYEWGWTREKCVEVIHEAGLSLPGKSSCFFCPSMKKAEIRALWEKYPELYERAIAIEQNAAPTLKSVKGLGRKWSWQEYRAAFIAAKELEAAQVTLWDVYDETPGGCLCGAPCGCYDG
jgi:hypothetical protein